MRRAAETDRRIGEGCIGVSGHRRVGVGAQLLIRNRARYRSRARPVAFFLSEQYAEAALCCPHANTPTRRPADTPTRFPYESSSR
jgi:hypothetical protein